MPLAIILLFRQICRVFVSQTLLDRCIKPASGVQILIIPTAAFSDISFALPASDLEQTSAMSCKLQVILVALCVSLVSCGPIRKESDLKAVAENSDDETRGEPSSAPLAFTEKYDDWETWEVPEKILKLAPYYKSGYDYDGLPIFTVQYGKWNYRELARLNPDDLKDFLRHYEQFVRRAQTDGAANDNAGIVFICDWDGFSLGNYASSDALKLALKAFTSITRFNDALRYAYQINTNFGAETFLNIARPFLGNILEKFEVYGARREKWRQALLRKIPSSQLPPAYGGDKNWKPVPWNEK